MKLLEPQRIRGRHVRLLRTLRGLLCHGAHVCDAVREEQPHGGELGGQGVEGGGRGRGAIVQLNREEE